MYCLKKEEGGRHTPFFNGYRPQFYFRTTDVTGVANLPEGTEMVMPGDNVEMTVELIQPIAMDEGLRFAIREGGRTVGSGVVTEVSRVGAPPTEDLHGGGQKLGSPPNLSHSTMATLTQNKIRIRLKAYDHSAIETAAKEIVDTATRTGASVSGPVPLPTEKNVYCVIRVPVQGQGLARALRDPHAQAADRHPAAHAEDGRLAPAARSPAGRRRHPDPAGVAAWLGSSEEKSA